MKEINSSIPYEKILDDTNQLIQISDCDSFTMLYANKPALMFADHSDKPYLGEKCYKYIMSLDEQCPYCPMRMMKDRDSFITEIDNGVQVFTVKTKRIRWDGKDAFIEYATDITMTKRAQQIFESQMNTLIQSIPDAQGIFHINLTQNKWISSNGKSLNIRNLQNISDVDSTIRSICKYIPDPRKQNEFYEAFRRDSLIDSYNRGQTEIAQETQSYYDDGTIRWAKMTARMIMNPKTGDLECVMYGMDISDQKLYEEKMALVQNEKDAILEKSKRDLLTGIYSKQAFEQITSEYIKACPLQPFAIIFTDLDNFKAVNDTLGHLTGDRAIIDTAEKLQNIFSNKDIVSRFGGDEFCILVKGIPHSTLIRKLDYMLEKLRGEYSNETTTVTITTSIGVVCCDGMADDIIPLIQAADNALYQAKKNGRDQYCIHTIKRK